MNDGHGEAFPKFIIQVLQIADRGRPRRDRNHLNRRQIVVRNCPLSHFHSPPFLRKSSRTFLTAHARSINSNVHANLRFLSSKLEVSFYNFKIGRRRRVLHEIINKNKMRFLSEREPPPLSAASKQTIFLPLPVYPSFLPSPPTALSGFLTLPLSSPVGLSEIQSRTAVRPCVRP